ncbi:hypothetical protein CMI41_02585 [Candidatus Pacearchaeota archaeon]|nr:hypothetical protein [Candidatus Pacearchaeota archaeon]|tara:strand:+ start:440 stop:1546 length:1107 start_codon:yes stop_codon:yes gene_type:complete
MKKLFPLLAILFLATLVAATEINVYEFGQLGCYYCEQLDDSGILEEVAQIENVTVTKYLLNDQEGSTFFYQLKDQLGFSGGTPTVVIECDGNYNYITGSTPIIENLESYIENCQEQINNPSVNFFTKTKAYFSDLFNNNFEDKPIVALIGLIIVALVDAINPCAFGVLIFLMIALLHTGSRKRALRYGIIYSIFVFITYFLAGFALFKVLQQLSGIRSLVYLIVGLIVLILGLIEFHDYLQARKGNEALLRISKKLKPFIEKKAKEGTLFAIMLLGIIVALFELPCTGGVYLPIITLLQTQPMGIALLYLTIYNIIFILPLLVITFLIYKGMSPKIIQQWNSDEKAWMRLAASIVMVLIAIWLISIGI